MGDASEIITARSWYNLCSYNYEKNIREVRKTNGNCIPRKCIMSCALGNIRELFEKYLAKDGEYVFVSSFSDYGLYKENDLYVIKCLINTLLKFNKIPEQIKKWFLVNCMLEEDKVEGIPFGVAKNAQEILDNMKLPSIPKGWLYVNFQVTNPIRAYLKKKYMQESWVTYKPLQVPKQQYLYEMSRHKFTLSPPGNGIDCYRTFEALYAGSIPIVQNNICNRYFKELPILLVDSFEEINIDFLKESYNKIWEKRNYDKSNLSYWRHKLEATLNDNMFS